MRYVHTEKIFTEPRARKKFNDCRRGAVRPDKYEKTPRGALSNRNYVIFGDPKMYYRPQLRTVPQSICTKFEPEYLPTPPPRHTAAALAI